MKTPTTWMVAEMETDVATMGYSTWKLDGTRFDSDGKTLVITRKTADDLTPMELLALVKPFFVGRHTNTIQNHHDGTYTVSLED